MQAKHFATALILIAILDTAAGLLIVDHTAVQEFDQIPDYWLNQAKELTLHYATQSHGSQIIAGLVDLENNIDPKYGISIDSYECRETPFLSPEQVPPVHRMCRDGTFPDGYWATAEGIANTRTYAESGLFDYSMFAWCWEHSGTTEYIQTYLDTLNMFEQDYPQMRFPYMTGHTGMVHSKNDQIRDYANANDKILFDFEDIETHDLDGVYHPGTPEDDCGWCSDWCIAHPEDCTGVFQRCEAGGGLDCCLHSHGLNCRNKAKAYWWMLARLAGWDGASQECTDSQTQDCPLQSGVCSGSEETCSGGAWPGCDSATYLAHNPSYEASESSCEDLLDNDCDGSVDCDDLDCSANPACLSTDNNFHVSPNGSGAHNGSNPENAFSLSEAQDYANSHVDEEITFLLASGSYGLFEEVNIGHNDWITYEATDGHEPVFSGINVWNSEVRDCYLRFDGIKVDCDGTAVYFSRCNYVQLLNMEIVGDGWQVADNSAGIRLKLSSYVLIDSCHIYGDGPGLSEPSELGFSGEGFHTAFDLGITYAGGVNYNNNVTVNKCEIHGCDKGIHIFGSNWTVTNNHIYNQTTDGIVFSETINANAGERTLVANNHIHDNHFWVSWSGHPDGIQMNHARQNHAIVRGNIIYSIHGNGMFFRPDDEVANTDWLIENNLIYDTSDGSGYACWLYSATDIVFQNNTVIGYEGPDGILIGDNEGGNMHFKSIKNNIIEYISVNTETDPVVQIEEENYNLIYRVWSNMDTGHVFGQHTKIFGVGDHEGFKALFNDYNKENFGPNPNGLACPGGNPNLQLGEYIGALPCVGTAQCTQDSDCNAGQICCKDICTDPACTATTGCLAEEQCIEPGTCDAQCQPITECVDTPALLNYISEWKQGQITILALMQRIAQWKTGC